MLLRFALLMALAMSAACSGSSPPCLQIALPAYFPPGDADTWKALAGSGGNVSLAVVNPDSGPGAQADPRFVARVAELRRAGLHVLGYVHTSYGRRPAQAVLTDVKRYRDWYRVSDVFFDEAASDPAQLAQYRVYSQQVRRAGGLVVLNPGTVPDRGYGALADVLLTFEGSAAQYRNIPAEPAWLAALPRGQVWHLVHSTPAGDTDRVLELARKRGAGRVYVTDARLPQPWDRLPTAWSAQLKAAGSC